MCIFDFLWKRKPNTWASLSDRSSIAFTWYYVILTGGEVARDMTMPTNELADDKGTGSALVEICNIEHSETNNIYPTAVLWL